MLLKVLKSEAADIAAKHFGAIQLPDALRGRVEMADAKIVIYDHHGLGRPLKRCQQEIRSFDHWAVVRAHRPILMPDGIEAGSRCRGTMLAESLSFQGC